MPQELCKMDNTIKTSLEDILNLKLSETQISQASLPINYGGIGIRSLLDLSLPAFISSCAGVKPLVSIILNIPVDSLALTSFNDGIETFLRKYDDLPLDKHIQHDWDLILIKKKYADLKFENVRDKARIKAIKNKEAGAWLHGGTPTRCASRPCGATCPPCCGAARSARSRPRRPA